MATNASYERYQKALQLPIVATSAKLECCGVVVIALSDLYYVGTPHVKTVQTFKVLKVIQKRDSTED